MLVAVVIATFITGGIAIIAHAWWLLWTCIGIVVLAIPAGKVVGIMDDTVAWGATPAATRDSRQAPEADPGRPPHRRGSARYRSAAEPDGEAVVGVPERDVDVELVDGPEPKSKSPVRGVAWSGD